MMGPVDMLRRLVEMESPTGDAARMSHIRSFLAAELTALGGDASPRGEHLLARFGEQRAGETIVLVAHMDTVWPAGTLQRMPFSVSGDAAHGPGALDMKGGIVVMLEAIRRSGPPPRPLAVLLTADEEIGSPSGRPLVEEVSAQAHAVLVVEPPVRDGTITTRRSGLARYQLRIRGQAAHAGHQGGGVSAVSELAHQTLVLNGLVDDERGVRVNVGQVGGGTR